MEFLHTLLRPFVDTYTMSAFTLRKLVGRSLTERDLLYEVLGEIKTSLDRGIVNYGENKLFFIPVAQVLHSHSMPLFLVNLRANLLFTIEIEIH